jgi:hypothetical protein
MVLLFTKEGLLWHGGFFFQHDVELVLEPSTVSMAWICGDGAQDADADAAVCSFLRDPCCRLHALLVGSGHGRLQNSWRSCCVASRNLELKPGGGGRPRLAAMKLHHCVIGSAGGPRPLWMGEPGRAQPCMSGCRQVCLVYCRAWLNRDNDLLGVLGMRMNTNKKIKIVFKKVI